MTEPGVEDPSIEAGGATIPRLGLGTLQITGQQCADVVETALEMGYRHIDTAQEYGNERMVGAGIAAADVAREDIFLTTKVDLDNVLDDAVTDSVHDSLDRLGVEYVDLLLIHGPHPRMSIEGTLDAMAQLQDEGLVEHLGVSNFSRPLLQTAADVTDRPLVTNQVLYHPYKDRSDLRAFCAENDMALTAYSPLARGAVLEDETLAAIGDHHDRTAVQVALRWLLQQDGVAAIPRTTSPEHLAQNRGIFDFTLTDEEVARVDALTPGIRQRFTYGIRRAMLRFVSIMWRRR